MHAEQRPEALGEVRVQVAVEDRVPDRAGDAARAPDQLGGEHVTRAEGLAVDLRALQVAVRVVRSADRGVVVRLDQPLVSVHVEDVRLLHACEPVAELDRVLGVGVRDVGGPARAGELAAGVRPAQSAVLDLVLPDGRQPRSLAAGQLDQCRVAVGPGRQGRLLADAVTAQLLLAPLGGLGAVVEPEADARDLVVGELDALAERHGGGVGDDRVEVELAALPGDRAVRRRGVELRAADRVVPGRALRLDRERAEQAVHGRAAVRLGAGDRAVIVEQVGALLRRSGQVVDLGLPDADGGVVVEADGGAVGTLEGGAAGRPDLVGDAVRVDRDARVGQRAAELRTGQLVGQGDLDALAGVGPQHQRPGPQPPAGRRVRSGVIAAVGGPHVVQRHVPVLDRRLVLLQDVHHPVRVQVRRARRRVGAPAVVGDVEVDGRDVVGAGDRAARRKRGC